MVCGKIMIRNTMAISVSFARFKGERELSTPQYRQNHHADSSVALFKCIFAYIPLNMFSTVCTAISFPPYSFRSSPGTSFLEAPQAISSATWCSRFVRTSCLAPDLCDSIFLEDIFDRPGFRYGRFTPAIQPVIECRRNFHSECLHDFLSYL